MSIDYEAYIASPEWMQKADRMRSTRPHGDCERCRRRPLGEPLQVHHLHYRTLGHESPRDLIVVCPLCHRLAHIEGAVQKQLEDLAARHPETWDEMPRPRLSRRLPRPRPARGR